MRSSCAIPTFSQSRRRRVRSPSIRRRATRRRSSCRSARLRDAVEVFAGAAERAPGSARELGFARRASSSPASSGRSTNATSSARARSGSCVAGRRAAGSAHAALATSSAPRANMWHRPPSDATTLSRRAADSKHSRANPRRRRAPRGAPRAHDLARRDRRCLRRDRGLARSRGCRRGEPAARPLPPGVDRLWRARRRAPRVASDRRGEARFDTACFYDIEAEFGRRGSLVLKRVILLPNQWLAERYYPSMQTLVLLSASTWLQGASTSRADTWDWIGSRRGREPRAARDPQPPVPAHLRLFARPPRDSHRCAADGLRELGDARRLRPLPRGLPAPPHRTDARANVGVAHQSPTMPGARPRARGAAPRALRPFYWQGMEGITKEELPRLFRSTPAAF